MRLLFASMGGYIPAPKGLDLVQSRSLRSLALTGQASSDGGALCRLSKLVVREIWSMLSFFQPTILHSASNKSGRSPTIKVFVIGESRLSDLSGVQVELTYVFISKSPFRSRHGA